MALILINTTAFAYIISDFSPSNYLGGNPEQLELMEEKLESLDYIIEDFDDSGLIDGLSISGAGVQGFTIFNEQWGAGAFP